MALFSRSAVVPTDPGPHNASDVLESELITWYFLVVILTLLVYDQITTIDKEVKYFWPVPLKPVSLVYFANRYIGLLGAVSCLLIDTFNASLPLCNFAIWTRSLSYWATIVLIDCILMMRVLALYSKDRTLTIWLWFLLFASAAVKVGLLIPITLIQEIAVYNIAEDVTICGERNNAPILLGVIDWLAPMMFGVILLVLALRKAILYWRMSSGFGSSRLIIVLINDQIIYFLLVVSCCVLNILQFKIDVNNHVLAGILSTIGSPSLLCILGSRMLFNLKEAGNRTEPNEVSAYRPKSIGKIEFIAMQNISAGDRDTESSLPDSPYPRSPY